MRNGSFLLGRILSSKEYTGLILLGDEKAMDLKFTEQMSQEQKLILTQEMKLSLKLLEMPAYELQENILKELDENPVLDEKPEDNPNNDDYNDDSDINYKNLVKTYKEMDYDYTTYNNGQDDKIDALDFVSEKKTFRDYLKEQMLDLREKDCVIQICNYIIEDIDDRGYLNCSIEEIAENLKVNKDLVSYSLKLVQGFRPWGVAARNLKECLKIQLEKENIKDMNIYKLVDESLELIADNKIKEIAKNFKMDIKKTQEYCNLIRSLNPKPSRGFYMGTLEEYVIPEAYIRRIGSDFYIVMNDSYIPKLTINDLYKNIINIEKDAKTTDFVEGKLKSAVFLIKGIESRKNTLYNILEKIVELQKEYFLHGAHYLKPMIIATIANSLNLHESTISRAIKDKYISIDFGTVRIKDLFTTGISSSLMEEDLSSQTVEGEIKKLIDNEDKTKPLSDQEICDRLKAMNIQLARRTVAKYREKMDIRSSNRRKIF